MENCCLFAPVDFRKIANQGRSLVDVRETGLIDSTTQADGRTYGGCIPEQLGRELGTQL